MKPHHPHLNLPSNEGLPIKIIWIATIFQNFYFSRLFRGGPTKHIRGHNLLAPSPRNLNKNRFKLSRGALFCFKFLQASINVI